MSEVVAQIGSAQVRRVFGYFVLLTLAVNLVSPQGSVASLPLQFFLKDELHLSPREQSFFQLIVSIPLYLSFLFGLGRDRLAARGVRDRTYFLIVAPITAAAYIALAFAHQTYFQLLSGLLVATLIYRALAPAVAALQATVGKTLRMTGRLSALLQVVGKALSALITYTSAWLRSHVSYQTIFLLLAVAAGLLLIFGVAQPREVAAADETSIGERRPFLQDLARLVSHRTIWPAVLIYLLWEFAPTSGTALLNHLTNTVHMTAEQYASYKVIATLTFLPGALLYGYLSKRTHPRKLLFWSMVFGVPQMLPLIFITSVETAYYAGGWYGFVGGMASAAVFDVLLRSCPRGFEGFTLELAVTAFYIADRFADWIGAILYERGGFAFTNYVGTAVYALILPLLFLVPREVLALRDAEALA